MSDRAFDSISRRFARASSRRSLLRGLIGAAAGAVALSGRATEARGGTVEICHKTWAWSTDYRRITVDAGNERRIRSHFEHGDSLLVTVISLSAANPYPVSTGIVLGQGETATITITGTTAWDAGVSGYPDANGDANWVYFGGFPVGSVAGAIGGGDLHGDPGAFSFVGTGPTTLSTSSGGELVLQYVDGVSVGDLAAYADNSGTLTATIVRSC